MATKTQPKQEVDKKPTYPVLYVSSDCLPEDIFIGGVSLDCVQKSIDSVYQSNVENNITEEYCHIYEIKYIGKMKANTGYTLEKA